MTQNHEPATPDGPPRPPFEQHRCGYLRPDETIIMFRALDELKRTAFDDPDSEFAYGIMMLGGNFAQDLSQQVRDHPHYADTLIADLGVSDHDADRVLAGTILYDRHLAQVYGGTLGDPDVETSRWTILVQTEQVDRVRQSHLQLCDILTEHLETLVRDGHMNLRPLVEGLNALLEASSEDPNATDTDQRG